MKHVAGAIILAMLAVSASAAERGAIVVRNATGDHIFCIVKKRGNTRTEHVFLKSGASWSRSYGDGADRQIRCEGTYSGWRLIKAGGDYSAVRGGDGFISVRRTGAD